MPSEWSNEQTREYWSEQARAYGTAPGASWTDVRVMEMEVREIISRLQDGETVLDVGCANGFSTIQFAVSRKIDVLGIDYIPQMIASARTRLGEVAKSISERVRFEVGDATSLSLANDTFDKVILIRVVINLGEWSRQLAGVRECVRVLRPGGILILSEATVQGWQRLNSFRSEWDLPPIPIPNFNNYVDETRLCDGLADICDLLEVSNYASSYYVGTRVLKPLLGRIAQREDQVINPNCELNRWFSLLPAVGDYGTQKMFFFRKKGGS